MSFSHKFSFLLISFLLATSCSKATNSTSSSTTDSTSNAAQTTMSIAGNSASSSEGGSVGFIQDELDTMNEYLDPSDAVNPFSSACTVESATTCSGASAPSTATIDWGGCTVDGGKGTMTGGWTEIFSGGSCARPLTNGLTITRTTSGSTVTHTDGATRTTDTNSATTWDNTNLPSTGQTISQSAGTRTIVINGIHQIKKNAKGVTVFDHYLKTSPNITVSGSRSAQTRVINGTIILFHNLAKYNATNTFNSVTYGSSTCCYPTSGSISTVLSGSKTGTVTLAFSNTCGTSTFTEGGIASTLTLDQCN